MPLRLVIADDHALFRQGLKSMLRLEPEVAIVGEVERVGDLADVLDATACDILLLDLQMDRSALSAIEGLARRVGVVVVTASEQPSDHLAAFRAGASALVFKRYAIETLMEAIRAVRDGLVWMPPEVQSLVRGTASADCSERVSPREQEIVRLVALGLRNGEIASRLGITEATVKTHLNKVFQKLGVRDRVELTRLAIRTGLVGAGEDAK